VRPDTPRARLGVREQFVVQRRGKMTGCPASLIDGQDNRFRSLVKLLDQILNERADGSTMIDQAEQHAVCLAAAPQRRGSNSMPFSHS